MTNLIENKFNDHGNVMMKNWSKCESVWFIR